MNKDDYLKDIPRGVTAEVLIAAAVNRNRSQFPNSWTEKEIAQYAVRQVAEIEYAMRNRPGI
jgi:hypothetical protein